MKVQRPVRAVAANSLVELVVASVAVLSLILLGEARIEGRRLDLRVRWKRVKTVIIMERMRRTLHAAGLPYGLFPPRVFFLEGAHERNKR